MTIYEEMLLSLLAEKQAVIAVLGAGWHPYEPGGGLELTDRIVGHLRDGSLPVDEPVSQTTVQAFAIEMGLDPGPLPVLEPRKERL